MIKSLALILSAVAGAAIFLVLFRIGSSMPMASASAFGVSAPMVGIALAFPALYLLWEQSEL
ncbi:MAG TPA: hypothetical protein VMV18_02840 [bacterium]|nr:hypothetical protein [bacterium]